MRFTEMELCDLGVWFATDKYDRIIALTSDGFANIPEFICESKENAQLLEDYFENILL